MTATSSWGRCFCCVPRCRSISTPSHGLLPTAMSGLNPLAHVGWQSRVPRPPSSGCTSSNRKCASTLDSPCKHSLHTASQFCSNRSKSKRVPLSKWPGTPYFSGQDTYLTEQMWNDVVVVTLIGYRASGKSTVGRRLATRLGWRYVDSDQQIAEQAGKSIAQIFAEDGEPAFREMESRVLKTALLETRLVLSAGGGAILREGNRIRMRQAGPVVWLRASVETIVHRLNQDANTSSTRPSLTGEGVTEEVASVLAEREPAYRDAATLLVETDGRPTESIVQEILDRLALAGEPE